MRCPGTRLFRPAADFGHVSVEIGAVLSAFVDWNVSKVELILVVGGFLARQRVDRRVPGARAGDRRGSWRASGATGGFLAREGAIGGFLARERAIGGFLPRERAIGPEG